MYIIFEIQNLFKLNDNHPIFKGLQLVAAALSFGHGANNTQKTMEVIAALFVGAGYAEANADKTIGIPEWVAISAYLAITLGTLLGS